MNNKNLISKLDNNKLETEGNLYERIKLIFEASNGRRKKIENLQLNGDKVSFKIKEKEKEKKNN